MAEAGKEFGRGHPKASSKLDEAKPAERATRKVAAVGTGYSGSTLDKVDRIRDGRNRAAACGLAGVEPWEETFEGEDPDGYALLINIARRHLTKGQQAMVAARARSLSKQDMRSVGEQAGVSAARICRGRSRLRSGSRRRGCCRGGYRLTTADR